MKNNLEQPRNMYIDRAWFKHQSSNFQRVSSLVCSYRNVKLLLVYSSIDLFYPFLFVYMLNFPLFLLVKRKRKLRATRVLASNNPINIMLHYTSAAISNRYCVTVPLAILILFLFINPYTLPSSFIVSFTIREIPQFFWQKRWWPSTYHDWLFVDEKTNPTLSAPLSPWITMATISKLSNPSPATSLSAPSRSSYLPKVFLGFNTKTSFAKVRLSLKNTQPSPRTSLVYIYVLFMIFPFSSGFIWRWSS